MSTFQLARPFRSLVISHLRSCIRLAVFATILSSLSLAIWTAVIAAPSAEKPEGKPPEVWEYVSVNQFLPLGFVKDGSVSYQVQLQKAIDEAAGGTLIFPPMVYKIDESGLKLHSHSTLSMYGAKFNVDEKCSRDGQAFIGHDVESLRIVGGQIIGHNDVWAEGVNIRGVYLTGKCRDIRIQDLKCKELSSNGIGVFGTEKEPVRDVWINDVVIDHCCNGYSDYLDPHPGPEKNSQREDQGLLTFYHVQEFTVRGCRLENSRSDGMHFYRCARGQFVQNRVYAAKMGGYFLETCEDVLASELLLRDNGSRGVTIERGSRHCTVQNSLIANSGREGLWASDCSGLIITGNVFDRNGRKPLGKLPHQIWNANITINQDGTDPTHSATEDFLIADNIITATEGQIASIRVDAKEKVTGIVIRNNLLRGENRKILIEPEGTENVVSQGNQ